MTPVPDSPGITLRGFSLTSRSPDDILFRRPDGDRTARDFLSDARRLANALPDGGPLCNLCQDRYWFAVTLAAGVLRERTNLLSSDRSPAQLRRLADRFTGAVSVADSAEVASPLRHHVIAARREPAAVDPPNPDIPADRLAAIVFTSGSTGEPVGTPKSWGALVERSRDAAARFGMIAAAPPSIVATVLPQHMYGFETTILQPLHTPASSWSGPAFYPLDVRDALAAVPPPRLLVTTPLQVRALLEAGVVLPDLACVISATAPLDPALAEAAERRLGTRVLEIFGATEVGSIASRRTVEGEVWTTYDRIRLTGAGSGQEGHDQVEVTAPFAAPHRLADVLDVIDPTRFRLLGRATDLVKLGGRRASLAGLNSILNRIPGVRDGVFVAPDDLDRRPTARLLAFVIAPDRSAEAILADLRHQIDPVFLPRRVVRVEALPRNEVGKLPRAAVLALQAGVDPA
jgi:acyl-coenzyme A synthetase/AMP-(fatty) acid ligase